VLWLQSPADAQRHERLRSQKTSCNAVINSAQGPLKSSVKAEDGS